MAELFAEYYKARLDATLFKFPDEVNAITAALNVDAAHGMSAMGARGGTSSSDNTPLAMAASRIIVYSLVFGL
jgi:7-keto-8-aminopelargonate synthetase-like enzyme